MFQKITKTIDKDQYLDLIKCNTQFDKNVFYKYFCPNITKMLKVFTQVEL